ncbi:histone deacetylase complex subunit SAP130 isoform X2 [Drosophila obscura]|uniref:histone deacetylase complex subunit SAP130 isoform X2 n=1 Tax=Drosophila obscura TaxID=7282 RepID=UPI001BB2873B|nr:histone deacetylase complex subunit SAP130 isoform X2 [Drosophila obscura]
MSASSEGGAGGSGTGSGGSTAPAPSAHSTVAAKITHLKTDGAGLNVGVGGISISGGTIKVAANTVQQTSLGATPIALNTGQATTAASIRAIGAGGQSTQVRVVMPMIKQLENVTATGRTQITAIPAAPARSVSNASITVTRPVTQATYLPRASVTATQMGGVGVGVNLGLAAGQRLVTPLRTTSTGSATVTPAAPTGLSTSGGFVRGTAATVSRSGVSVSSQQPSTVISSSNNAAWMQSTTGQMQLIRAIHQPRQRIITTSAGVSSASVVTTGVQAPTALSVTAAQSLGQQQTTGGPGAGPQAYVATVLPPRQHQATLVYSSNVSAGGPNANPQPGQQFNPRFAVTTPTAGGVVTTTTPGGTTVTPRQVRPIPLGKSFPATKLNTTSISIRAPSIPQLNASVTASQSPVSVSGGATVGPGRGPGLGGTALTATNLPTRIIQLQQPGPGATQQIIGAGARLAGNVMLQPFLMSTSAAAKMGIRPPVTMTAKVQPSLTITQLNPIGKLATPGGGGGAPTMTPQGVGVASIQAVPVPSVSANVVNPNSVSGQATAAAGGATVLPLTISGRGGSHSLTGTLTPIKNASGITVGKMMMTPAVAAGGAMGGDQSGTTVTGFPRAWNPVVASQSQLMKIDDKGSSATIYYESMPASASTGVLSLATTTLTQSTQSQAQLVSSAGGSLSVSSLPFPSHAPMGMGVGGSGPGSQATFTVLPSGQTVGGAAAATRTTGHQQLIIPMGGNSAPPQHMVIPLHTSVKVTTGGVSSQPATISGPGGGGATLVSSFMGKRVADGSPIRAAKNLGPTLLSMASNTSGPSLVSAAGSTFNLQPVSVSVASSVAVTSSALTVEALAKKERERAPPATVAAATAVRNLRGESPASSDGSTTVSANSSPGVDQQQLQDRIGEPQAAAVPSSRDNSTHFNPINELYSTHQSMQQTLSHASLGARGSSSAFVDVQTPTPQQQHQQQQQLSQQSSLLGHLGSAAQLQQQQQQAAAAAASAARMNGTGSSSSSSYDCSVRKKPRRSTNDSQHSTQSQASLSLPPPTAEPTAATNAASYMQKHNNGGLLVAAAAGPGVAPNSSSSTSGDINHRSSAPAVAGNKENANPVDFVLRRPRNCSLLNTYKPTHKLANNHFHRYTDVKPREERGASIIDLANQPNVQGKINGWKLHHLRSQMEDLNESETFSMTKLESMLKDIEKSKEKNSEMERVSELLKGNIQRSKIITEGINESQNQLMKVFEHKPHVSDIINRCASKRNFKKRDKI